MKKIINYGGSLAALFKKKSKKKSKKKKKQELPKPPDEQQEEKPLINQDGWIDERQETNDVVTSRRIQIGVIGSLQDEKKKITPDEEPKPVEEKATSWKGLANKLGKKNPKKIEEPNKVKTQKEMHDAVLQSLNCEDSFAEQRKLVSNRFHTYRDGHSSNRIIESILR